MTEDMAKEDMACGYDVVSQSQEGMHLVRESIAPIRDVRPHIHLWPCRVMTMLYRSTLAY